MRSIENTLALWVSGLLTSGEVVDWANVEIARVSQPTEDLFNLASYGPDKCLKWSAYDFSPPPSTLTYVQQFALRALDTSIESRESIFRFADWASKNCLGEDLSNPMVRMGYQLDQLLEDWQEKEGVLAFIHAELPTLSPQCKELAHPFLAEGAYPSRFAQAIGVPVPNYAKF